MTDFQLATLIKRAAVRMNKMPYRKERSLMVCINNPAAAINSSRVSTVNRNIFENFSSLNKRMAVRTNKIPYKKERSLMVRINSHAAATNRSRVSAVSRDIFRKFFRYVD
jgi:hypothetical protein